MKKHLCCPVCGSAGEDMLFAFYCSNENCQNFRIAGGKKLNEEAKAKNNKDENNDAYSVYGFWPYGD